MTEEERQEEARLDDKHPKPRWSWLLPLACVLGAVTLVLSGFAALRANTGAASAQQVQAGQAQARVDAQRMDCRSEYNARLVGVRDERDALVAAVTVAFARGEFTKLGDVADRLDALNTKIANLPRLDEAVDHGWVLDGTHFPPCPG